MDSKIDNRLNLENTIWSMILPKEVRDEVNKRLDALSNSVKTGHTLAESAVAGLPLFKEFLEIPKDSDVLPKMNECTVDDIMHIASIAELASSLIGMLLSNMRGKIIEEVTREFVAKYPGTATNALADAIKNMQ